MRRRLTTVAQADDNFASLTYGQTSDKVRKSGLLQRNTDHLNADGIIGKDDTWGVRVGKINDQGRYYMTYDNVSGTTAASSCARKTCSAATTCSCRSAIPPSCSAAAAWA